MFCEAMTICAVFSVIWTTRASQNECSSNGKAGPEEFDERIWALAAATPLPDSSDNDWDRAGPSGLNLTLAAPSSQERASLQQEAQSRECDARTVFSPCLMNANGDSITTAIPKVEILVGCRRRKRPCIIEPIPDYCAKLRRRGSNVTRIDPSPARRHIPSFEAS
ncbi:unnamed protein product, partial [Thelazia callipaeda]|uniref:Secreted protein n=1 Tax=Thelazia callipaeda TaxID=103827 RepID=A0A0N5CTG0_THECL